MSLRAVTTAESQFDTIVALAEAARDSERSAVHTATVSNDRHTLNVFGWHFGVIDVLRAAKQILADWRMECRDSPLGYSSTVTFSSGDFRITFDMMK